MEIRIVEINCTAEVIFSPPSEMREYMHATAMVDGKPAEDALTGARIVLDLFAKGRNAFIRVQPEAASDTNFDTKETKHLGYVRFSFRLEAGHWNQAAPSESLSLLQTPPLTGNK